MNDPNLIAQGLQLRIARLIVRHGHEWDLISDRVLQLHDWLAEAEMKARC